MEDVDGNRFAELALGPEEQRQWIATLEVAGRI
jgi:hypothetical protein